MTKYRYYELAALMFFFAVSLLFVYVGHEIWGGVIGLFILVICSWFISRLDLAHPLTWFPPAFFLYSTSLPILVGLDLYVDRGAIRETLLMEWVALLTFIVFSGSPKKLKSKKQTTPLKNIEIVAYPVYIATLIICSIYLAYIFSSGMGKYEITLNDSPIMILASFFSIYVLSFLLLFGTKLMKTKKIPLGLLIFNLLFSLLILLVTGERDVILKVALGAIFFSHLFYKRISKTKLFALGSGIVVLLPVMQNMKSGFVKTGPTIVNEQPLIYELLGGEFISASRNLNTLLINSDRWDFFMGQTFLWDIQVALFKGSNSTLGWFNRTFYPNLVDRGGGQGFSLVGEGYMNFGVVGVILVFAFIALVLRYVYYKATNNVLWLVIYVAAVPIFVYLNRADLANLYAQVGKHIIIPLFIIYAAKVFLESIYNKAPRVTWKSKAQVRRS